MTAPGLATGPATGGALLLEREQELIAFDRMLDAARRGASSLIVVEGPAGIGKSRLVAELRERAEGQGLRVLAAHGSDLEKEFPFGVVRQLFESMLSDPELRGRVLVDAAAPAGRVFDHVGAEDTGDVSFAALHGLYWLTVNVAGDGPLLLSVDDLHWCDRPSLRFVAYLARRLEGLGVVLAVGLRTAETGTDPVLIGEVVESPAVVRVNPGPLTSGGVADLIRSRLGEEPDPAFAAACLDATGGNPLLLRQLLSSLEAEGVAPRAGRARVVAEVGPRAVSRTVLLRLRRLAPDAATVAQAVAVLGDGAELPLVAGLAELGEEAVARATAALARAEILRAEPPLGFVHPLVRDAVYHELPPGERALRHARAAHLLTDARAPAEEVATHLLAAPRRGEEWVVDVLWRAAGSARRKGAADSAVAYLERALDEPPPSGRRTAVLRELGLAETLVSGPAAAAHLREAREAVEDPRERAEVAAALSRTLLFTGAAQEAVEVAKSAAEETPPELVDERQALRALALIAVFFGAGDRDAMRRLDSLQIEGGGPGAKMLAAILAFARALTGASAGDCVPLAREALADGILIDADPGMFPVAAIWVLVMADEDDALGAWEEMRALAHRDGSLFGILTVNLWRGATLLWRGELREGEEALEAAREGLLAWGFLRSREAYGPAFLGAVRAARGDLAGARAVLYAPELQEQDTDAYRLLLRSRAELLLSEGRHEEALAVTDDLSGRFPFWTNPGWAPWRSLRARALDRLGHTQEAIELSHEELELARRFGSASLVGRALRVLGTIERERGVEHLREAVEVLERSKSTLELARALLGLGVTLRHERKPSEARTPLRRALELAELCGADALAEQARSELHAAGARPRTSALGGVESLTASERRVADLAAEGRTNKEIAQALYVTPKTVEVHLSNAYRKLGIASRRELGRVLAA